MQASLSCVFFFLLSNKMHGESKGKAKCLQTRKRGRIGNKRYIKDTKENFGKTEEGKRGEKKQIFFFCVENTS